MIDFVKLYLILYIYMKTTIIFIATCLVCHYYKSHSAEGLAPMVFIIYCMYAEDKSKLCGHSGLRFKY